MTTPLHDMPDEARVWISGFTTELKDADLELVRSKYESFLKQWKSHGKELRGAFDVVERRFVILALENDADASGCAIDASMGILKDLKKDHNLDALGANKIFFEKENNIECLERIFFSKRCKEGEITPDTVVYNCLHTRLGEYRELGLKTTFKESWHAKAFKLPTA